MLSFILQDKHEAFFFYIFIRTSHIGFIHRNARVHVRINLKYYPQNLVQITMEHLNKIVSIKVFKNLKFKLLKIYYKAVELLYRKMKIYRNEPDQYTLYNLID